MGVGVAVGVGVVSATRWQGAGAWLAWEEFSREGLTACRLCSACVWKRGGGGEEESRV